MRLDEYMEATALSDAALAERIGVARATVTRYRNQRRTPRREIMQRIIQVTRGKVTANDWLEAV